MTFTVDVKSEKRVEKLGRAAAALSAISAPAAYELTLAVEDTDIRNSYRFYVYPDTDVKITDKEIVTGECAVSIAHTPETALEMLKDGRKVIYIPEADGKLEGT